MSRIEPSCTLLAISEWITEALSSIGIRNAETNKTNESGFTYEIDLEHPIDITVYSKRQMIVIWIHDEYITLEHNGIDIKTYYYCVLDPNKLAKDVYQLIKNE